MIEPVMYGPTPSMIIERLESPPPEKIFKIPKNWLLERNLDKATVSMPGIGIAERSLKTTRATKTNNTLFRNTLSVQINFILFQNDCIVFKLLPNYFIFILPPFTPRRFLISENFSTLPPVACTLSFESKTTLRIDLNL